MKTFKRPFLIDLAFIMSIQCSEHTTQPETIFFSEDFFVVIHQYYLFFIAFTCAILLLFLRTFIFVLLSFSMNFKSNISLNFDTISLF